MYRCIGTCIDTVRVEIICCYMPLSILNLLSYPKIMLLATLKISLKFDHYFSGNYSCLVAKFHLSRSVGFHMVQTYVPSVLIVVISWVSFWMDVDSVAGRTTLGVTTLLTVSSKSAGKSDTNELHPHRGHDT